MLASVFITYNVYTVFVNTRRVYILRELIILHTTPLCKMISTHFKCSNISTAIGRVFTISDGLKYIKSKTKTKLTSIRCVLFRQCTQNVLYRFKLYNRLKLIRTCNNGLKINSNQLQYTAWP